MNFFFLLREDRREFIQSKYVKKKFVKKLNLSADDKIKLLRDSIDRQDLKALLSVFFQVSFFCIFFVNAFIIIKNGRKD